MRLGSRRDNTDYASEELHHSGISLEYLSTYNAKQISTSPAELFGMQSVCQMKPVWEKWAKPLRPVLMLKVKGQRCLTSSVILPLGGAVFLVACVNLSLTVKALRNGE